MGPPQVFTKLLHHGAAANSSSRVVLGIPPMDASQNSEIVFASHAILNVAVSCRAAITQKENQKARKESIWKISKTLRTQTKSSPDSTNTVATSTAKRVITCLTRLLPLDRQTCQPVVIIVCGFSDGTITSWYREGNGGWVERIVVEATDSICNGRSVTDIAGAIYGECVSVVACTSAGADHYAFRTEFKPEKLKGLVHTPANAVSYRSLTSSDNASLLILVGTAAPRHNRVHVFLEPRQLDRTLDRIPQYCGALSGHEDWITCFDWFSPMQDNKIDLLASGSQDAKIRLWQFRSSTNQIGPAREIHTPAFASNSSDDDDHDEDEKILVDEGEARLRIVCGSDVTSATLEALLIGHEDSVTAVAWHPNPKPIYGQELILISSSMDRTILIWSEHASGVWTPVSRVGSAGGILGGSVGSSLLGFLNVQMEPIYGRWMLGHGYGGALHFFACDHSQAGNTAESEGMTVEDRAALHPWKALPCLTGHFDGVTDLCWESESGAYLITTSSDQTCRIWAPLDCDPICTQETGGEVWVEIARPQVHGYNLSAVTSLSSPEHPHLLVSGADEKEIRVLDATNTFLHKLATFVHCENQSDSIERVERAYIPSLGLSNKAAAVDGAEEDLGGGSESSTLLPLERDLGAVSLWPEIQKLYGHQTEIVRLTSTFVPASSVSSEAVSKEKNALLASSAKARDQEAAAIRIWDVKRSKCLQVLNGGHKSTVTAMHFSYDGEFLASAGKDRRLCIWRRGSMEEKQTLQFGLASRISNAHKRIIWTVHFCPFDPSVLVSGSRDGTVKVWRLLDGSDARDDAVESSVEQIFCFKAQCSGSNSRAEAVTSLAFAPRMIRADRAYLLAIGMENGLIELWSIPRKPEGDVEPTIVLCLPSSLCHIGMVTKLEWRPISFSESQHEDLVLASCSADHGCRIYQVGI